MNNILYIGNKLSGKETNQTYIEILGGLLESENYKIVYASDKKNQIIRLCEMIFTTIKNCNKVNKVLIDTYSTSGFIFAFTISQLCRLLKIKYIPILHGGNLPNRMSKNPKFCKMIFDNSYINVAPSAYLQKAFLNAGFKNTIIIPNVIDLNLYQFQARIIDVPRLLWVRSFSEIYNPKMAILVFNEIIKKYPNAELCMVGPNKNKLFDECKKLSDSLNLNIKYSGKLAKKEWIDLSKNYNIFINTTHFDNTPVSVLEAMALGLPVISTNVGGITYLINDNKTGFLVNDNDIELMSNKILNLLKNKTKTNEIILNARKQIENFDWKMVKKLWFEILN
ncbi:MAG: glycosyltransferase family 4 protein [Flavobacterium sp.]|nr:glycosyltransferase family 4 protein [Flavobacterium sp.]